MKVEVGLNTYTVSEGHILMRSQHYWFTCRNKNDIIIVTIQYLHSYEQKSIPDQLR